MRGPPKGDFSSRWMAHIRPENPAPITAMLGWAAAVIRARDRERRPAAARLASGIAARIGRRSAWIRIVSEEQGVGQPREHGKWGGPARRAPTGAAGLSACGA